MSQTNDGADQPWQQRCTDSLIAYGDGDDASSMCIDVCDL